MKTTVPVSVEEYLRSAYDPDRDYVDGEVEVRNLGERDHSELQRELIVFFAARRTKWNVFVFPEQRVQVAPTRFRIPDLCAYIGKKPAEQVFRKPPFICIEILSPEDRMERTQARIDDYLNFGVPYIWVINPRSRRAWTYSKTGSNEVPDGRLRTENPSLEIPLKEIFVTLDIE